MVNALPHYLPDLYAELSGLACHESWTPSRLRRFFLLMLRGHWSATENHDPELLPALSCMRWDPDDTKTEIGVELEGSKTNYNGPTMIWVSIGNYNFEAMTLGSRSGYENDHGTDYYTLAGPCQLLVRHEAAFLDQAYDMAWSSMCFLLGFRESILDALGGEGQSFTPQLLGQPQLQSGPPVSRFRVDVGCKLDITLGVATTLESHKLKRVANLTSHTP